MRNRAGIIIYCKSEERILLIKRIKNDARYWVIPGGGVEANETYEEAARREIKEELGLLVDKLADGITIEKENCIEKYYITLVDLITDFSIQGEEKKRSNEANQYILEWVSKYELPTINLLPKELKYSILEMLK